MEKVITKAVQQVAPPPTLTPGFDFRRFIHLHFYNKIFKFKPAFTLAEVLITLGIIGVVAALTIPNLITNYKKHTVETRLIRFYTTMNQALKMSIAENGQLSFHQIYQGDSAYLTEWYRKYIIKYIKTIKEEGPEANNTYYKVTFIDGSGFASYYGGQSADGTPGSGNINIFYYINGNSRIRLPDGKDSFFFVLDIKNAKIDTWGSKSQCKSTTDGLGCAGWIKRNGWKIPEDYPIKF